MNDANFILGINLLVARLFAEGIRSAFGALPIEGLPDDRRCSASFGVTEFLRQDGIDGLMRRADRALYDAKRGGRDRIRAATQDGGSAAPRRPGFSGRG